MTTSRWLRRTFIGLILYVAFCTAGGIFLADSALRPARRSLSDDEISTVQHSLSLRLEDASITASDGATLRAWSVQPAAANGDAVILLHGLADNRVGMTGYAQLFLRHGFTVLLPDARAHGDSGGALATYGLLERNDILDWANLLNTQFHAHCIFGFGESMGASQLLQSLDTRVHFCGVAAESPFANFREIAYDRMGQPFHLGPWVGRTLLRPLVEVAFLRARWKYGLDMSQVSPESAVASTSTPVLLIHGTIDSNIPVRHSRIIRSRNPKTQLWEVPGADHCGAISRAPDEFERKIVEWFHANSDGH